VLGRIAERAVRTGIGRRLLSAAAIAAPELALGAAGWSLERRHSFDAVSNWPDELAGFEDCAFLFASNQANHGVAQLSVIEGAYLFRLLRGTPGPHVEIGRYKGGGTLLMATALRAGDELWSYDTHEKAGRDVDAGIRAALDRYGLAAQVNLVVGDSHKVKLPADEVGVVFLDGDPTLEGTRRDADRWGAIVRRGGLLLFHDAAEGGPRSPTLAPLVADLDADDRWAREGDVGTIVRFRRVG
jgi:predicted O-methyltransferase YrrM